jgi:hypothetical protein
MRVAFNFLYAPNIRISNRKGSTARDRLACHEDAMERSVILRPERAKDAEGAPKG